MTARIFVACEGPLDARVAQWFVNEMVVRELDWLRELDLDPERPAGYWKSDDRITSFRIWAGREEAEEYFDLHGYARATDGLVIDGRPLRLNGHIGGAPAGLDVRMVRACLILAHHVAHAHVAVIVRDVDNHPGRSHALAQLREAHLIPPIAAVLGHPVPEVEAWVVAGFAPQSADEATRLNDLASALSFDPTREPHRLRSQGNPERDAKTVFAALLSGTDPDRWKQCLALLLEAEDDRGALCGVRDFLDEIRTIILPWARTHLGAGPTPPASSGAGPGFLFS